MDSVDIVVLREDSERAGVFCERRGDTVYVVVLGDVAEKVVLACYLYAATGLLGGQPARPPEPASGEEREGGGATRSCPLPRRVPRTPLRPGRRLRVAAAAGIGAVALLLIAAGVADAPGRDQGVAGVDTPTPAPPGPTPTGSGRHTLPAPPTGRQRGVVAVAGSPLARDDAPAGPAPVTLRPVEPSTPPSSSPGATTTPSSSPAPPPSSPPSTPPRGDGGGAVGVDVVAAVYRLLRFLLV